MKPQKAVLVTGGAGYIGSHTCKALSRAGYLPVSYDNLVYGHRWAVRWGPLVEGDVADGALLERTFADFGISAVLHFAGSAYVGESIRKPLAYFRNNAANTLRLLECMRESNVNTIVFSSTCATYGVPATVPIDEGTPQQPINPYGESKLFVERMMRWCEGAYGLRWMALRYFNAAGADAEGEIGEDHTPETHLIPLAIQAALGQRDAIDIFGTDYATPDGTAIRDYIHVTDLAAAHVRALNALEEGTPSGGVNLGTGRGHSVREVVAQVRSIADRAFTAREMPRRPGDPPELVADARRALEVLKWRPQHSTLGNIVETAWRWHSGHRASEPFSASEVPGIEVR